MPILPDTEAAKLLEGGSPDWSDPGLDEQLRERLGPDYRVYTRYVRVLRRRIEHFSRKLGLDQGTMLPPWILNTGVDKGLRDKFFRDTWRRIKGGFDTSAMNRLLAEIQGSINQLAKFTKGSAAVAPKRVALQNCKNSRNWLQFRDHARRLFKSLGSHWFCACLHSHRASLRLDIRQMSPMHEEKEVKFNILFSNDTNAAATTSTSIPWNWLQVDVQPLPSTSKQTTTTMSSQRQGTKHVSFDLQDTLKPSVAGSSASVPRSSSSASKINDLCDVLSQRLQSLSCVGYLDDHEFQQHMFMSADIMDADESQEIVSFYDIKFAHGLGVKEKYALALTVASAVLHLQATPWLKERWCLDDIHFIRGSKVPTLINRPYVTKTIFSPNGSQGFIDIKDQPRVALIEISFGVPILSLREKADPDFPGISGLTEFWIATRLVHHEVIKDREHDEYAEVVFRCMKGSLSTGASRLNLEDAKVQQSFYEDVVLPLQRLNQMLHKDDDVGVT
ncbi:MAG: hypothetical protein LQ342_006193 [Letrouitia transgressa]|nr:MAG: hypothetical protein LQ342_006193 [Letrouitia transgressa]